MRILVLGSSAGGGFPQWNCNCNNCDGMRRGSIPAVPRTQSSIAITANGNDWLLVNASPDILTQIRRHSVLQPARAIRDSGIAAVLLMDAQIDHVTGLLMLRESSTSLTLLATPEVLSDISHSFPIITVLSYYCGTRAQPLAIDGSEVYLSFMADLRLRAIPLSSKPPPYSAFREHPRLGDNIGVLFTNTVTGNKVFYAPGLAEITPHLLDLMRQCEVVMVDGTFWSNDEMIRLGLSSKTALDMGHLPQSGQGGMIEHLGRLPASVRRILIHINNTNPILIENSPERAELTAHGIEVAHDGLEIVF